MCNRDIITCPVFDFLKAGLHSTKDLEEFIVSVFNPALLPFWVKEFVDFGFRPVNEILNLSGVRTNNHSDWRQLPWTVKHILLEYCAFALIRKWFLKVYRLRTSKWKKFCSSWERLDYTQKYYELKSVNPTIKWDPAFLKGYLQSVNLELFG